MVLTDTHTHLYYEPDADIIAEKIDRCIANSVTRLFLPNVDAASVKQVLHLVYQYPHYCFPMLGLHPCDVKGNWETELDAITQAFAHTKVYAIGEIGIDLYHDKTFKAEQQLAFKKQIAIAKQHNLPIVIHCRDAFNEVLEVLESEKDEKLRGIFHCFAGTIEQAQKVINLGFYLGIGGVVTYKNAGLDKIVEQIDLQHIVLETDSPYLTPVPHRGKPNESAYLTYIAQKIADLHRVSIEKVAAITTANSETIFGV